MMARVRSRGIPTTGAPHRVVVVGGGFGGLPACRFLGTLPVEVTLIDRRNHHLFQPLLYQVATGMLSPGQVAPALRHVLRRCKNVRVELAEVTGFDLDRKVVFSRRMPGEVFETPYDSLIVAAGAGQTYFGHDEYALYAPGMKTVDDALELRRRIFGAFEMAETSRDEAEREQWLTFVVVGAGPTGVEIAGQICEVAQRTLEREFRNIDLEKVRVLLVDGNDEPLATFGHKLSQSARRTLERMGVELHMNGRVTNVDGLGVEVRSGDDTSRIGARTVVWAAGVHASPLAQMLGEATGADVDRAGRVAVAADLTLPDHPEVFAVGDMALTPDKLPGVAEVAMQGSLHAAHTIVRRLRGEAAKPYRYRDLGSVAAIGRFQAICSLKRMRLSGLPAWIVWMFVHLGFLNGFGNRFTTTLAWLRSIMGRARAERVFSVAHTGGDLSAPDSVRATIQPNPFPQLNTEAGQALSE
jgi:NADH dehydrogenase